MRKSKMRIFPVLAVIACLYLKPLTLGLAADPRPNILVIMSDDQGAGDSGFAGNPWARTPVLDALAGESAWFGNFVAGPACTPSRAAFLTGRNFHYTGVWGVGPRGYIRRDEVFLPSYLGRAGYRSAHIGKWGEGWTPDQRSYKRGYDEAWALGGGYQHKDPWFDNNGTLVRKKGWTSELLVDLTIDFIRRQTEAGRPWYAITAFIAPHEPWEAAPEYTEPLEKEGYSKPLAAFYGMLHQMDTATGRLLDELDDLGVSDNTIVVYVSDNGATPVCRLTGGTPMDGEDWERRNALGLRGRKSMVWENGILVPFYVRWPGRIPPGERTQFGTFEDILPTILDLADVPESIIPERLPLHGKTLKPVLIDPATPDDERYSFQIPVAMEGSPMTGPKMIIEDPSSLDFEQTHTSIRGPRFKYHRLPDGIEKLFDMKNDPGETTDISDLHPERVKTLAKRCRKEWDKLMASGRGFWMPAFLIGDPRYKGMERCWAHLPPDVIPGNAPQKVTGTVRAPFNGAVGFTEQHDSATYAVDVRAEARYEVTVTGEYLDECAPLLLKIGDTTLEPEEVGSREIRYGTVRLQEDVIDLGIIAGPADNKTVAGVIREISLNRTNEK